MTASEPLRRRPVAVALLNARGLIREGLRAVLVSAYGISVVGFGANMAELSETVGQETVDVVIVDETVPGGISSSTLRSLKFLLPAAGVIVMVDRPLMPLIRVVEAEGALAIVGSDVEVAHLVDIVLRAKGRGSSTEPPLSAQLTRREAQVLGLISLGMTNQAIGLQLGIATGTVKRHANSLFVKLGVRSRIEAANVARSSTLASKGSLSD